MKVIGRNVKGIGTITDIMTEYYTEYEDEDGKRWVGTPYDLATAEEGQ